MGIFDQQGYGALLDPQTAGILSAAMTGLQASGPSNMPRTFGQIAGMAGQAGLGAYQNALNSQRQFAQTQALIDLEKQKAALTNAQVEMARRKQAMLENFMGGGGPVGGVGAPPVPGGAPAPSGGPMGGIPATPPIPPNILQAIRADLALNEGKGVPGMIAKAGEPVVGREGGIFNKGPNGELIIDPGWLAGEKARQQLRQDVDNENTMVSEPTGVGDQKRMMTKGAQLRLAKGETLAAPMVTQGAQAVVPSEDAALQFVRSKLAQGQVSSAAVETPMGKPGYVVGKTPEQAAKEKNLEAGASEAGKKDAEVISSQRQKIPSLAASMISLNQLEALNKDDKTYASSGAAFKKDLGRLAQAFGVKVEEDKTANTEAYIARLGELLKERLASKDYGSGTGISNLDLATAGVPLPEVAKTQQGRQLIIEALKKDVMRSYGDIRSQVEHWEANKTLEGFKFPSESVLSTAPKTVAKGAPKKGDVVDGWEFLGGDPSKRINWRQK